MGGARGGNDLAGQTPPGTLEGVTAAQGRRRSDATTQGKGVGRTYGFACRKPVRAPAVAGLVKCPPIQTNYWGQLRGSWPPGLGCRRTPCQTRGMAIFSLHHDSIGRGTHPAGTAAAHVRYITRRAAAGQIMAEHLPSGSKAIQGWLNRQEREDRKNARVIDKLMGALPLELASPHWQALIRVYLRKITRGRAAWLAVIHDRGKDRHNPHVHIVIRDRDIDTGARVAQLSEKGSTERLRRLWEETVNEALAHAGHSTRIDRRSLKAQGIDRMPRRHRGPRRDPAPNPKATTAPPLFPSENAVNPLPNNREVRTYTFPSGTCARSFHRASRTDSKMCFCGYTVATPPAPKTRLARGLSPPLHPPGGPSP